MKSKDWKTDPYYGYYKKKKVNGFLLGVSYLPTVPIEGANIDSSVNYSVHFILEIATDGKKSQGNFLYKDAGNQQEFTNNVNYFNFYIDEDVTIMVNGMYYKIALNNMENTYTLNNSRKIHFIAVPVSTETSVHPDNIEELIFIYDDSTLGIGYTKFTFEAKNFKPISNNSAQ